MKRIPISRLPSEQPLPYSVWHESGRLLHERGELFTAKHLYLLQDAGIREVYTASRLDNPEKIREDLKVKLATNIGLCHGDVIMRPVFSEDGQLIVESGKFVDDDTIAFLLKNNISAVYVAKSELELHLDQVSKYRKNYKRYIQDKHPLSGFSEQSLGDQVRIMMKDLKVVNQLEALHPRHLRVQIKGIPLLKRLPSLDPERLRTKKEVEEIISLYDECEMKIEELFKKLTLEKKVSLREIDEVIANMLKMALKDRSLMLAIMHQPHQGEYLYRHTLNVVTLCVNLALLLGYDEEHLKQLAYAAFFNDAGMLLVPDFIRNKTGALTEQEQIEIRNHTTYSVRLALRIEGIPQMLPLIIFQTQERLDGSGYPKGKKEYQIHDLAKVVSVADIYSAMIAQRPYRKGELPYKALEELILLAGQRKCDSVTTRALLQAINLFPIGTWVEMSDKSLGVVTCPNEREYARPFVRIVYRENKKVNEELLVEMRTEKLLKIDHAVAPPPGSNALEAFYKN